LGNVENRLRKHQKFKETNENSKDLTNLEDLEVLMILKIWDPLEKNLNKNQNLQSDYLIIFKYIFLYFSDIVHFRLNQVKNIDFYKNKPNYKNQICKE